MKLNDTSQQYFVAVSKKIIFILLRTWMNHLVFVVLIDMTAFHGHSYEYCPEIGQAKRKLFYNFVLIYLFIFENFKWNNFLPPTKLTSHTNHVYVFCKRSKFGQEKKNQQLRWGKKDAIKITYIQPYYNGEDTHFFQTNAFVVVVIVDVVVVVVLFFLRTWFDFERCAKTKWRNVDLFQTVGIHNFYLFIYFCFYSCCSTCARAVNDMDVSVVVAVVVVIIMVFLLLLLLFPFTFAFVWLDRIYNVYVFFCRSSQPMVVCALFENWLST